MKRTAKALIPATMVAVLMAGCESPGPQKIDGQNPTVTYKYDPGEGAEAQLNAEKHCQHNYQRKAHVLNSQRRGRKRIVTFECVPYRR